MNEHSCLLCLGSNIDRHARMETARQRLGSIFPDIQWGRELTTEATGSGFLSPFSNQLARISTSLPAEEVRSLLKQIEKECGRLPEDKGQGIVRMDIDLLTHGEAVLKPDDLKKDYIRAELERW